MSGTRWSKAEEKVLLLPVNLRTGCILWLGLRRGRGGSNGAKPALWLIFPSRSICSQLRLNTSGAVSLLEQPHLMRPTKECDCSPMLVLAMFCLPALGCGSLQRSAAPVWHHTIRCNVTFHCQSPSLISGHLAGWESVTELKLLLGIQETRNDYINL